MPEFTLYTAPVSAPCRAVLLHHSLLGESAPDLEMVQVDLSPDAAKLPELLRNNPLHKVPTLVTPWGPLWESRTIMRFMESLCPEPVGYPLATFHRASVDRLLDWDLGTLFFCVSGIVYPKVTRNEEPDPNLLDQLNDATRFLDQKQLGDGRAFLTGNDWTIADLSCHMTLSLLRLIGLEVDDIPRVSEWDARMRGLAGWDAVDAPFQASIADLQGASQESAASMEDLQPPVAAETEDDASSEPEDAVSEQEEQATE